MKTLTHLQFIALTTTAVVLTVVLSAFWLPSSFFANTINSTTMEGAKEALGLMKDWTLWMAGIQTATIASLGLISKESEGKLVLDRVQVRLVALASLFNTFALFFSAWLLTSTSSLMLRACRTDLLNYDFYNWTLYAYMQDIPALNVFSVGYFVFWNHWLWAAGILLFGTLSISLVFKRQ